MKEVVKLVEKQKIILKHLDGISKRSIADDLHISKDTVNKYVAEYECKKTNILRMNLEADPEELIQEILEEPKFNSANRKPKKITPELIESIEDCLDINEQRRANGMSKQQMKKIDIHDYLVNKKDLDISYSTVKRLIKLIEDRHREAIFQRSPQANLYH